AGAIDHEILRLEIAINDALYVSFSQGSADFESEAKRCLKIEASHSFQQISQRLSLDEFHRDVWNLIGKIDLINSAHILVRDLPSQLEFVFETFGRGIVVDKIGFQELQGDDFIRLTISSLVDDTHSASTRLAEHLVALIERVGKCHSLSRESFSAYLSNPGSE